MADELKPLGRVLAPQDWPVEVTTSVLGNFKVRTFERMTRPFRQRARDRRPGMSPEHLANIRRLPCALCGSTYNVEAHHLKSGPARRERGIGLKATDRYAIPLCGGPTGHHADIESYGSRREEEYCLQYNMPPYSVAQGLWNKRGSLTGMLAVLQAHWRSAILDLGERDHR
jgi:hypothetical protein